MYEIRERLFDFKGKIFSSFFPFFLFNFIENNILMLSKKNIINLTLQFFKRNFGNIRRKNIDFFHVQKNLISVSCENFYFLTRRKT